MPMSTIGLWAGCVFGLATLYLFVRRLALPRPLYLSGWPDYVVLALVGAIAASGLLLRYWAHVYVVDVKAFMIGLLTLHPVPPPQHPLFLIHFLLALALLVYLPFSKLLHAGGVFFSPTLNQPWEVQMPGKRYANPWDEKAGQPAGGPDGQV
jgi:nitrate reductase gamma subunit